MKSIDLFSCIGCHAIGFQRAGIETMAFCEINPWRREKIWDLGFGAPIFGDIREYEPVQRRPDIIIGGPPCQATSVAAAASGKRTGATLWPEMLRIVVNTKPEWVIVEQPPGNAAWEAQVYRDLKHSSMRTGRQRNRGRMCWGRSRDDKFCCGNTLYNYLGRARLRHLHNRDRDMDQGHSRLPFGRLDFGVVGVTTYSSSIGT